MSALSTAPPPARSSAKDAFSWRFTAPLYLGAALNPINSSLIATALAPIATAAGVSVGRTSVLVAALYLASAVGQPTAGRLAEVYGPRRVFLAGIMLVLVGGLVGGLFSSLPMLTVSRALIGLGTSAGYPTSMLLIRRRAEDIGLVDPPGRVLGGLAVAATVTAAVGLPVGGLLVGVFGWRSTFLINVPVALITLLAALRWVPRDAPRERASGWRAKVSRIDVLGIAGFGGALTALLVFLLSLPSFNGPALLITVVLAGAVSLWELRAHTPFLDLRLLTANLALTRTYLRFGLTMLGSYAVMYGISQWLVDLRGFSPEEAGLLLLPLTIVSAIASGLVSRRNAVRGPLLIAGVAGLLGAAGVLLLDASAPVVVIIAVTVLFGVVSGTAGVGNQTALYLQAPANQLGTTAGLLRASGYLGSVGSSAITSIVFHDRVSDSGVHGLAVILLIVAAIVLVMTVVDRRLASGVSADAVPHPG